MTRNRPLPVLSDKDDAFVRSLLIHEDAHILVFNKPSGLAVQGGSGVEKSLDDLLVAFAKSNGKRPHLVHRIDQPTSGLVIAARTKPAAAYLSEQFATRLIKKTYLALIGGRLPEMNEGVFDCPLARVDEGGRARMIAAKQGRKGAEEAVTRWKIEERAADKALISLFPETGRMHQLRAHLSIAGCPILGDALYGEGNASAPRLMLHASYIQFRHPKGIRARFSAEVPEEIVSFGQTLRRAGKAQ